MAEDPDELMAKVSLGIISPDQVVGLGKAMDAADPSRAALRFNPMIGGLPAKYGQECLDLVVNEVMPHFR
jgi:hypothetical protein